MNLLAFSLLLVPVAWAQVPAEKAVPVSREPSHHLVFENQYTRAYRVEVPVGKATLMHRHDHDYIFVVLGDAHISNEPLGKPAVDQELKDGDVKFARGPLTHVARNLGETPFRNVTIEVLRKSNNFAQHALGEASDAVSAMPIVESDAVKVTRYEIAAGRAIGHEDRDCLLVAIGDLHLRNGAKGSSASELAQKPGDVVWTKLGGVTNTGKRPARFVVLEFR